LTKGRQSLSRADNRNLPLPTDQIAADAGDNKNYVRPADLEPFLDKEYRDAYLDGIVKTSIALQITAIRNNLGQTQAEFAKTLGVTQSVVSRLENTEYGSVTINTLLKVARETNVALDVRFVSYPEMLANEISCYKETVQDVYESFQVISNSNIYLQQMNSLQNISTSTSLFLILHANTSLTAQDRSIGALSWQTHP